MKPKKKYSYNPDYAVPPGETVREIMETLRMNGSRSSFKLSSSGNLPEVKSRGGTQHYLTKREFAARLGIPVQILNHIFKGKEPITNETANRLEKLTGTPASFWNKLEYNSGRLQKVAEGNKKYEAK